MGFPVGKRGWAVYDAVRILCRLLCRKLYIRGGRIVRELVMDAP